MNTNENNDQGGTAIVARESSDLSAPKSRIPVESAIAIYDTAKFEHMWRIATAMGTASLIPDHLRGPTEKVTIANCFLIVNQADRWGMDPFAVAQSCFILHGKIGYEGKLVTAMIESKIGKPLDFTWEGEPGTDDYKITVGGYRPSDGKYVEIEGTVGDWKTFEKNGNVKGNWIGLASRNQLAYRGSREWARLYASGLMLGVYTPDEMEELNEEFRAREARDITPPAPEEKVQRKPRASRSQGNKFQEEQSTEHEQKTGEVVDGDGVVDDSKTIEGETVKPTETKPEEKKEETAQTDNPPVPAEKKEEPPKPAEKPKAEPKPKPEPKAEPKKAEAKPITLGDIAPGLDKASADVKKRIMAMHDDMAKSTTIDALRAVWRPHYMSDVTTKPWSVADDKLFQNIKDWHIKRIKDEEAAKAAAPADDGFDPPDPNAGQTMSGKMATSAEWEQFKADLAGELAGAQDGDEVTEIFNRWTEIGVRQGTISDEQMVELRPLAEAALDKFG